MQCYTPYCKNKVKGNKKHCDTCIKSFWRLANPVRDIMQRIKDRAKRDGIPYNLEFNSFNDWCVRNNYPALRGRRANDMTVDRVVANDPRGYHIDNIQMMTNRANSAKRIREYGNPNPKKVEAPCPF